MSKLAFLFILLSSPIALAKDTLPDLLGGGTEEIITFLVKAFQGGNLLYRHG